MGNGSVWLEAKRSLNSNFYLSKSRFLIGYCYGVDSSTDYPCALDVGDRFGSANRKIDCACNVDSSADDNPSLLYSEAHNPN